MTKVTKPSTGNPGALPANERDKRDRTEIVLLVFLFRNVSMTLRQPGVEFKLGCLGSSAGPHSSVKYNKATYTTWQSLAEENVGLKGARCARIASGD